MPLNPFIKSHSQPSRELPQQSSGDCMLTPKARKMDVNNRKPESIWLYAHPTMKKMAQRIVQICSVMVSDTNNEKCHVEFKDDIKWDTFQDGFPNLFIDNVKKMAGHKVIFLGSFHTPAVIFEQLGIIYSMPRYMARSFTFILPYFPTGTMERVDTEGQIATAKTLATVLSEIPLTAKGPSQIIVFDIHALQERFYFSEKVIPRLESAIPLLIRALSLLPEDEKIAIAFPDDGAHKRFSSMFKDKPQIVCQKRREGTQRIITVKDGDPQDCHVVIVDDLIQTGGTLIESAKALLKLGAKKVSGYVTHAVFPNESWKKFTGSDALLSNFWITDSIPHAIDISEHPPFKLLHLADIISDVLLGFDLVNNF